MEDVVGVRGLALLALLGVALGGCEGPEARPLTRWRLERDGLPALDVTLPGNLAGELPRRATRYALRASVPVDEAWRGRELQLVVPSFDGLVSAEADGVATAAVGLEAPRGYRQPGPHRFTVPAEATRDGHLELALIVDHRYTGSAWFGAAPRLLEAGRADALTWAVWTFNLVVAAGALVALFQIGMTSAMVYVTDRRRRPYLYFGIQALTAQVYPLHVLGFSQLLLHELDVPVLAIGLLVAIAVSVRFTHTFFGLARPSPWFARLAVLAALVMIVRPGPFDALFFGGPAAVVYLSVVAAYQVVTCTRLFLRGSDRRSAGYQLLAWVGLALAAVPDFVAWTGLADPLHGLRVANIGLGLFAFWQSLLFSQRHISSLAESDQKSTELGERVAQLERHRAEIEQLNAEMRRQLSEKSSQIYAALALAQGAPAAAPQVAVGDVIEGRYRVERRLGAGGMGEVFEVTRVADGRRFALKLTHEVSGVALARLAREAQVALTVTHENVVQVVDVDVATAGFLYIVMELVDGAPLRELERGEHSLAWSVEVLAQVARGLEALHAAGVVHRDLKPANVLVTDATDGGMRVKITDFGISIAGEAFVQAIAPAAPAADVDDATSAEKITARPRPLPGSAHTTPTVAVVGPGSRVVPPTSSPSGGHAAGSGSPITRTGLLPGTPAYIAPELLGGRSFVTPAADMFAFGVMAYEILAGRRPFAEPPVLAMLTGRAAVWPEPLRVTDPTIPAPLSDLVDACMAHAPDRRPTARQTRERLAAIAAGLPALSSAPAPGHPATRR
jgi:serine/threonine-protein kinase